MTTTPSALSTPLKTASAPPPLALKSRMGSCWDQNLVQISDHPFSFLIWTSQAQPRWTRRQRFPLRVPCADKEPPSAWLTQGADKKKKNPACIFIPYRRHELGCFPPLRHLPGAIKHRSLININTKPCSRFVKLCNSI